jgi:hypothetical protein
MTDQLLDTPQSPEAIAQSLYIALWLRYSGPGSRHAAERHEHARSEVARIFALPPEQMPAPVRLALFGNGAGSQRADRQRRELEARGLTVTTPAEYAALQSKADAADLLLAALGTDETDVAVERVRSLRAAADALRTADGILALFPVPEGEWVDEAMVVRRARAAVAAKMQLEGEAASERLRADDFAQAGFAAKRERDEAQKRVAELGAERDRYVAGDALHRIADAVHLNCGTAGEVADAAVARITALERDVETQAQRIRETEAQAADLLKQVQVQRDHETVAVETCGAVIATLKPVLGEVMGYPQSVALARRAVQIIEKWEKENGAQARRIRELEAEVHNLKVRVEEAQREVAAGGRIIEEVRAELGRADGDDVISHAQGLVIERDGLLRERDEARAQRDKLAAEVDAGIEQHCATLNTIGDALGTPNGGIVPEHAKAVVAERDDHLDRLREYRRWIADLVGLKFVEGDMHDPAQRATAAECDAEARRRLAGEIADTRQKLPAWGRALAEYRDWARVHLGTYPSDPDADHRVRTGLEAMLKQRDWFLLLWGRVVGEKPLVGAQILGSRYRLVNPQALKSAAEGLGLPVASFDKPRTPDEPGFWSAWLDELAAEFARLDGLRQGAEGAYKFASRVIDDATALLRTAGVEQLASDPPPVGAEAPLVDLARGAVAQLRAVREKRRDLGEKVSALQQQWHDTVTKAGERISDLEVRLLSAEAARTEAQNYVRQIRDALDLDAQADIVDCINRAKALRKRREAAKQLREVGDMLDGAARAAGVPWHDLKGWIVDLRARWHGMNSLYVRLCNIVGRFPDNTVEAQLEQAVESAVAGLGEARVWLAWAGPLVGPHENPQIARERIVALINGYSRQCEAVETMHNRTAEAERAATAIGGRWRCAMQRLAVFLGIERPDNVQPEDLEDMCKGAVRAQSLQRGNGMTG